MGSTRLHDPNHRSPHWLWGTDRNIKVWFMKIWIQGLNWAWAHQSWALTWHETSIFRHCFTLTKQMSNLTSLNSYDHHTTARLTHFPSERVAVAFKFIQWNNYEQSSYTQECSIIEAPQECSIIEAPDFYSLRLIFLLWLSSQQNLDERRSELIKMLICSFGLLPIIAVLIARKLAVSAWQPEKEDCRHYSWLENSSSG